MGNICKTPTSHNISIPSSIVHTHIDIAKHGAPATHIGSTTPTQSNTGDTIESKLIYYIQENLRRIELIHENHSNKQRHFHKHDGGKSIFSPLNWRSHDCTIVQSIVQDTSAGGGAGVGREQWFLLLMKCFNTIIRDHLIPFLCRSHHDGELHDAIQQLDIPHDIEKYIAEYMGVDNLNELIDVLYLFIDLREEVHKLEDMSSIPVTYGRSSNYTSLARNQLMKPLLSSITTTIYRLLYHEFTLKQMTKASFRLPRHHVIRSLFDAFELFDYDVEEHEKTLYLLYSEFYKHRPKHIVTEKDEYLSVISQVIQTSSPDEFAEEDNFLYQPNCHIM